MAKLLQELQPFLDAGRDAPSDLMARILERVAQLDFESLDASRQKRWMALCDSFSDGQSSEKTPNNIWRSNAYCVDDGDHGAGFLYELCCRANHSCRPNLSRSFDGNAMVLVAKKAISKGDELFTCYRSECLDDQRSVVDRRRLLKEHYNFVCECQKCGPAGEAVSVT